MIGSQCVAITERESRWKSQAESFLGRAATGTTGDGAAKSKAAAIGCARSMPMPRRNRRAVSPRTINSESSFRMPRRR